MPSAFIGFLDLLVHVIVVQVSYILSCYMSTLINKHPIRFLVFQGIMRKKNPATMQKGIVSGIFYS